MVWKFKADQPIYAQLIEHIALAVITGEFPPGSRLPSVRELASEAGVNPNTMQRAFGELEREGLLFTQRTAGRFVTEDTEAIGALRARLAGAKTADFVADMRRMGCGREEVVRLVEENMRGEKDNGDL